MNVFRWKRHHKKDEKKKKSDLFRFLPLLFSSYGNVSTSDGRINHLINIHILHNNPNFLPQFRQERNETKSGCRYLSSRREDGDDDDAWVFTRPEPPDWAFADARLFQSVNWSCLQRDGCGRVSPTHSRAHNVTARRGKDNDARSGGLGRRIDQGQHRLYLVLARLSSADQYLSVYDAMKTAFHTARFLWPRTQFIHLNSYIH